jgi:nicotinamidase-related amidase
MFRMRYLFAFAALGAVLGATAPVSAGTIIDEWSSVQAPPAPKLVDVTVDAKTTALLVLDLIKQTCNNERRPRCIASLPQEKKILAEARAHGLLVVYSVIPGPATIADTLPEVAPKGDEPIVKAALDKFAGTDLDKILKDKGIKSVILIGTSANGAILNTGTAAFFHGYQTIIPVDGLSGDNAYVEQFVVYDFASAPVMGGKIVLTRIDMIKF